MTTEEQDESPQSPLNWRQIATGLFMTLIVSTISWGWGITGQIQSLRETDINLRNDINTRCQKEFQKNSKASSHLAPAFPGI